MITISISEEVRRDRALVKVAWETEGASKDSSVTVRIVREGRSVAETTEAAVRGVTFLASCNQKAVLFPLRILFTHLTGFQPFSCSWNLSAKAFVFASPFCQFFMLLML